MKSPPPSVSAAFVPLAGRIATSTGATFDVKWRIWRAETLKHAPVPSFRTLVLISNGKLVPVESWCQRGKYVIALITASRSTRVR